MLDSILTLGVQSTLVLAMAGLLTTLLRRGSAAQRHCLWTVALGLLAVLPWWPEQGWTWREDRVAIPVRASSQRMVVRVSAQPEPFDWTLAAEGLWAAGAGILFLRIAASQWRLRQIRRRARVAGEGTYHSSEVRGPLLIGLWRPQVLLPMEAQDWSAERLRVVMLHESMHVERRDLWWMSIGQVVAALFWPQPLVWLALRAQKTESEQACDDAVMMAGVKASCYADHLVAIASSSATGAREVWMAKGGLAMAQQSQLEQRLRAMLNPVVSRERMRKASVAFAVLAGFLLLAPVAGWKVVAQEAKASGIHGVVQDASGARVPNARVTLVFPATSGSAGASTSDRREITRTDAAGEFQIPSVPTGSYIVRVEQAGFARLEQSGVAIDAGQTAELRLVLNVGGLKETLQVTGDAREAASAPVPNAAASRSAGAPVKIRVGGNVMASKLELKVTPLYPRDCKAERVQGTVLLRAVIGKEGTILDLQPINEFVDARLREAATTAVKQWRYKPTLLNGEPVEVITEIEVNFTLLA